MACFELSDFCLVLVRENVNLVEYKEFWTKYFNAFCSNSAMQVYKLATLLKKSDSNLPVLCVTNSFCLGWNLHCPQCEERKLRPHNPPLQQQSGNLHRALHSDVGWRKDCSLCKNQERFRRGKRFFSTGPMWLSQWIEFTCFWLFQL